MTIFSLTFTYLVQLASFFRQTPGFQGCPVQSWTKIQKFVPKFPRFLFISVYPSALSIKNSFFTCFLLARVQFPPRVIRVKRDRYCIFALFKDTNNFCKPLGEKSTKKLTQKVTFTYFKNYSGFIMEPIDN